MLLGFRKRFVEPIELGTKVFTMRKPRKIEPKIGETLHMYTALRTKHCKRISNKEKLVSTQKVNVKIIRRLHEEDILQIMVDGRVLHMFDFEVQDFIRFDGFKDQKDFCDYWISESGGVPWIEGAKTINEELNLYHWTDLRF